MKIELAEYAGFCFGVRRALKMVENNLDSLKKPVKMYGALVHNEEVVKVLQDKGIEIVNNINQAQKGTLIITAHGTRPYIKKELEKREDLDILDTTCPRVAHIHDIVSRLRNKGRAILIYGDRHHQEVKGIQGTAGKGTKIFSSLDGLNKLNLFKNEKYGLVAQTTQNQEKFKKIKKVTRKKIEDVKVCDTICNTTSWRQQEARKIANNNDIMLVIGSHSSANTTRLYQISKKENPETYFIQTYKDIKKNWFFGKHKVGVTAGASTPDWVIQDVIDTLAKLDKEH